MKTIIADKIISTDWTKLIAFVTVVQLVLNWLKDAPIPEMYRVWVVSISGLVVSISGFFLHQQKVPTATPATIIVDGTSLPQGVDDTGPADDIHPDVIKDAVSAILAPAAGGLAPVLAGNVVDELRRVLKRGIRL